jgi:hypothetical protein
VFIEEADRHIGPLLGKEISDRAADATVAAGDERDFTRQLATGTILRALAARLGIHVGLQTRLSVLMLRRPLDFLFRRFGHNVSSPRL